MAKQQSFSYDEERVAFYAAIGGAISSWANIEHSLCLIVIQSLGVQAHEALSASFYSIENFRSKLAFVDKAMELSKVESGHLASWEALREEVRSLSAKRNQLAHCRTIGFPTNVEGRRIVIVPIFPPKTTRPPSAGKPPQGSIGVKDVDLIAQQFAMASTKLLDLFFQMHAQPSPHVIPARQEPQPLQPAQLVRRIRATFLPPEKA